MKKITVRMLLKLLEKKEKTYPITYEYCNSYIQEDGGYISLAGTFLSQGDMGKVEDRDFYCWIKEGKSEILNNFQNDFIFQISDDFNGKETIRPNQKWHFIVSYLAMKEYFSTERYKTLCQKYPSIGIRPVELRGNETFFDLNAFGNKISIAMIKSPELLLWLAEAVGIEKVIIDKATNYAKEKIDEMRKNPDAGRFSAKATDFMNKKIEEEYGKSLREIIKEQLNTIAN